MQAAATAALGPGSTSGHGKTLRLADSTSLIGLHHAQQLVALGSAADERVACMSLEPQWLWWLPYTLLASYGPAEHGLFASGGDRALGIDVPIEDRIDRAAI